MKRASWDTKRSEPYTDTGIKRMGCVRCGQQAKFQWQICSDGNNFRPLCAECDVALNWWVLQWMNHPRAEELMSAYRRKAAE
jgi:hypothetical protein